MSDSYLNRGAINPAAANTVAAAARGAADRMDRAIDLLENNYPQVQSLATGSPQDWGQLATPGGRDRMLSQLRNVRNALNDPSKYTNIVLDSSGSGADVPGYVNFYGLHSGPKWTQFQTNIVTSFIHLTPFFFTLQPPQQAHTLHHELGRYYNSMGEELTHTWNDVYGWDSRIRFLNDNYDYVKSGGGK